MDPSARFLFYFYRQPVLWALLLSLTTYGLTVQLGPFFVSFLWRTFDDQPPSF